MHVCVINVYFKTLIFRIYHSNLLGFTALLCMTISGEGKWS